MSVVCKSCLGSIPDNIHRGDDHNEDITPAPSRYGVAEPSLFNATLCMDGDVRGGVDDVNTVALDVWVNVCDVLGEGRGPGEEEGGTIHRGIWVIDSRK